MRMLFFVEPTDLNVGTFNEDSDYYVIPKYSPLGSYLRKLSSEIHGKMYHGLRWINLG